MTRSTFSGVIGCPTQRSAGLCSAPVQAFRAQDALDRIEHVFDSHLSTFAFRKKLQKLEWREA
ncbi:hypothetical protein [Jannaschia sp. 2305UL9-9]|uniref:hypothetical protein n=1 Tax=Jannaschia sp. 2305UL9-9 TaxID=3121638 RepID=UPI0035271284